MVQKENSEKTLPKVFRLSELMEKIASSSPPCKELPFLCQCVQSPEEGKFACLKALKKIKSLIGKSEEMVFASCCCYALKVIPFKINDEDAYLVHTRSVVPDYVHLSEVAEALKKSFAEYKNYSVKDIEKEFWEPIRPFDETFAEEVFDVVKQQAIKDSLSHSEMKMLDSQREGVMELGRIYGKRYPHDHPAFDVVVYNLLKRSNLDKRGYEGLLATTVAVRTEQNSCIVRLIIKKLGLFSDEFPLPIVGMAFTGIDSPQTYLKNTLLDEFRKILLGEWVDKKCVDDLPLSATDDRWKASVAIHVNKEPDQNLLDDIRLSHEIALNMAANTLGTFLLEQLQEKPGQFMELLDAITMPTIFSIEGVGSNILWFQILEDLKRAAPVSSLFYKRDVLRDIFDIPGRQSPLTSAVCERINVERWQLLSTDLRDKGSRYKEAMEADGGLIFFLLDISDCDKDAIIRYLKRTGIASAGGIAKFIKYRSSIGDKEAERTVWETTAKFCEENNNYDILKKLYEAILAPGLPRTLYYLQTEALGMLVTGITAGRIHWYKVAERVARNKASRFAKQKIMSRV